MRRLSSCGIAAWLLTVAAAVQAQVPSGPGDWPQWRGPNRDGISHEKGLLKQWPEEGPKVLWQIDSVGAGYSSLAVKDGRIFTQGDIDGVEHILAIDANTGRTLWAVQPSPVAALLTQRLEDEFKKIDQNGDGRVDELEALRRFGWDFNKHDQPVEGDGRARAASRAAAVFAQLDADKNNRLSYAEAANVLRDEFERADAKDEAADVQKLAAERAEASLKAADESKDGRVSRQESRGSWLDRKFGQIDERDPATNKGDEELTRDEIVAYLVKSEPGRDGELSADELAGHYASRNPVGDGQLTLEELRGFFGGYRNGMGDGPRGTPTVDGERVYVEGGNGDVTCLEAASGKTIWHVNLRNDFGGNVPGWGYSESPLIVGDRVIVTPGGKQGTVLALNKKTGEKIWQSADLTESAHYVSAALAEIHGIPQIVQFARESVFGVALDDGRLLWKYNAPANGTANCCTPIIDGDLVFASSSYGTGGGLAKVSSAGSLQEAEEVYFEKKMACHHGGIVKIGDYMYSNAGGALICMNFATGDIAWQSRSVGKGSLVAADGMLYVLSESQQVALVEATPEEYREHGRFKYTGHGRQSWAHPVVAGGKLFIRDQQSLTAYDVAE
ncbi:MAG: PQQ-binding-like beta-propeller repeat protein [Pirellulaceae bacterium]